MKRIFHQNIYAQLCALERGKIKYPLNWAAGVLHNLHVKWPASDSEEEPSRVQDCGPAEHDGNMEVCSDSSDDEGLPAPRIANPNAAPIQETCSTISQKA